MNNKYNCEFFVAGAGIAGICAAIQAGRLGLDTVIVEREITLGGNAGPLLGVGPSGALVNNQFYTETGIMGEIEERLSKNGARPSVNYMALNTSALWDRVVSNMLREAGVRIFRKHLVKSAHVEKGKITSVEVLNIENLEELEFAIKGFVLDATGDAHVAALSGAKTVMGREAKTETGERSAPAEPDDIISSASLMAISVDTGVKSQFIPPAGTPKWNPQKPANTFDPDKRYNYIFQVDEGGDSSGLHTLHSPQELYEKLVTRIYSIWDYFKNTLHKEKAATHELIWISPILGKRESRRIVGDYMLTQTDIEENRDFADAAGFGGFYLDFHPPSHDGGYETVFYFNPLPYQIPLRCLYSINIKNLFSGGRAISATHIAFTSTRVMRTGGLLGQSVGVCATLCHKKKVTPAEVASTHTYEFQLELRKNDVFIPGINLADKNNLVETAEVSASSEASLETYTSTPNPTFSKDPLEARIYCIPDKIEKISFYVRNNEKSPQEVSLKVEYGKTETFIQYSYDEESSDPDAYEFHYPERENDVTVFQTLFEKTIQISPLHEGWMTVECPLSDLSPANRKIVRTCLKISLQGTAEIASADLIPDVMESTVAPLLKFTPDFLYGKAENIKNGFIHREGIGLPHQWTSDYREKLPQWIEINFKEPATFNRIDLTFDTTEKTEPEMFNCQGQPAAARCISDYSLESINGGKKNCIYQETGNVHRFRKISLDESVQAEKLILHITNTVKKNIPARVYDIRVYNE